MPTRAIAITCTAMRERACCIMLHGCWSMRCPIRVYSTGSKFLPKHGQPRISVRAAYCLQTTSRVLFPDLHPGLANLSHAHADPAHCLTPHQCLHTYLFSTTP